jgi:nitroimidazol reductase NimA-like FMN-containing flavoprotein (pyridoxamine 5'-phosphate oxidase superfamily)
METDLKAEGAVLEEISRAEALRLMATQPVGRLVYTRQALPAITPLNFTLHDGRVLIVTEHGSVLAQAVRGAIVAFEADHIDPATHTGWSVTVLGPASVVTDPLELDRLRADLPHPWAGGIRDHVVTVRIEMVTGRRVNAGNTTL